MTNTEHAKLHTEMLDVLTERNKRAAGARAMLSNQVVTQKGADEEMTRGSENGRWAARLEDLRARSAALVTSATAARDKLIDDLRNPATADSAAALLQESQITRAWARTKQTLDSRSPAARFGAVVDAFANADAVTTAALLQELPAYFTANGDDPAFIGTAVRQAHPEIAAADSAVTQTQTAHGVLNRNVARVTETLTSSRELPGTFDLRLTDPQVAYRDRPYGGVEL